MSAGLVVALCLASSAGSARVEADHFELRWIHSIEKTQWTEQWRVLPGELLLQSATVETSGAGMDIPEGAVLVNGQYRYAVNTHLPSVTLSHSPFAAQATLCMGERTAAYRYSEAFVVRGKVSRFPESI